MTEADIPQVAEIERESFPSSWPQTAYKRELQNTVARYVVLTEPIAGAEAPSREAGLWGTIRRIVGVDGHEGEPAERVLGFLGMWLVVGEAHVVTVAVRAPRRREGIGERLFIAGIELAIEHDQETVTLEVRRSNEAAQRLYRKYDLQAVGTRPRYYTDNHEDAVIMTSPDIGSPSFRARFEAMKREHQQRHPELWA